MQKLPKEETVVVCPLNSDGSLGQFEWLQYYTSDIEYMATLAWVGTTESVLYDVSDIARTKRKEYIEQYQSFKLARKLEQEAIAAEKARVELKKRKREAEIKQRLYTKRHLYSCTFICKFALCFICYIYLILFAVNLQPFFLFVYVEYELYALFVYFLFYALN